MGNTTNNENKIGDSRFYFEQISGKSSPMWNWGKSVRKNIEDAQSHQLTIVYDSMEIDESYTALSPIIKYKLKFTITTNTLTNNNKATISISDLFGTLYVKKRVQLSRKGKINIEVPCSFEAIDLTALSLLAKISIDNSDVSGNCSFKITKLNLQLIKLQEMYELEPSEIKKYRQFIKTLGKEEKKIWYNELQKHVKYHSQRDNENPKADVMYNLTTLAMNLEYLGISCPDSKMQFEDWLEKKRVEKKYPIRTSSDSWIKLARDFNIKSERIDSIATTHNHSITEIKNIITEQINPYLESGHSISLSAFTFKSQKGHIVKLQSIRADGIIVDDPYGKVKNFSERVS